MASPSLMTLLCRSNQGILRQKLSLMDTVAAHHGLDQAKKLYSKSCPLVKASVGQHYRHSLDHLEYAVEAANDARDIHYDIRKRGNVDEHDWDAAVERINSVYKRYEKLAASNVGNNEAAIEVNAFFMLSGDANAKEYALPSTVARELGFAAHHAIHHLAMVRLIATQTLGLRNEDIPSDFGRAPSTVNFDAQQT